MTAQNPATTPSGLTYVDAARIVGTGLISTGIGLLVFVVVTVTWGDPFTRIQTDASQQSLAKQLTREEAAFGGSQQLIGASLDPRLTRTAARRLRRELKLGDAAGRMTIPAIGLKRVIVKGAGHPQLQKGPGIYNETPFPGTGAPVAIAGHRTTYGAPFLDVDRLKPGDRITLDMPYARFTYSVTKTRIITPTDWSIIQYGAAEKSPALAKIMRDGDPTGGPRCPSGTCEHLVLTACHPKYSAAQRIAVFARLEKVQLRAGAGA